MKLLMIEPNGWVYEKVCLYNFKITTNSDSKPYKTPFYALLPTY